MATVAACGFECGLGSVNSTSAHHFNNNGTTATDTGTVHPGGGVTSLKVTCNGSAASAQGTFFTTLVAAGNTRVVSFWLYIQTSLPSANAEFFRLVKGTATRDVMIGFEQSSSKLCIYAQTNFAGRVLGPVIAHSTWYRIDLHVNGTGQTADWQVDGSAQTQLAIGGTAGTYSYLLLGHNASTDVAFTAYTAFYDDAVMSATSGDYPLTNSFIVQYVLNADGTHNTGGGSNFTNTAGTSLSDATTTAWQLLDEVPPTTTDRVEQRLDTSGARYMEARFNSTGASAAPLSVDFTTAYRTATAANASASIKMRDNAGTTDDNIVSGTINSTTDLYLAKHYAARPAALGAWTQAALQDIRARFGFGTDVTPDIWFGGMVAEARFAAPTSVTVTPTTLALALATFAPTVTASNHQSVTPTTASLTTAAFAPVVALKVIPDVTALTLATFAPTITATQHQTVTPTTASLSLSAFAPTVSTPTTVTPDTAALTLATFAPTISSPATAIPTTASLALTTFAPTVSTTAHQTVTPDVASLAITTLAPVVSTPVTVTPDAIGLSLATFAPSVTATANQTVTAGVVALTLATFAPGVTVTAHQTVTPTTASLALSTFAPPVSITAHQTAIPTTASLALATFAPTVAATAHQTVTPDPAALVLTTFAPSTDGSNHQVAIPTPAALTLSAFAPTTVLTDHQLVTPTTTALTLSAFAPSVASTAHQVATPDPAALSMTAFAPDVVASDHRTLTPSTAELLLATFAPNVLVQPPDVPGILDLSIGAHPSLVLSSTSASATVEVGAAGSLEVSVG
jgi:ribosomal protein S19